MSPLLRGVSGNERSIWPIKISISLLTLQLYFLLAGEAMLEGKLNPSLVDAVNEIGEELTAAWLASYGRRFKPYHAYFDAMELIDPTAPDRIITPEVWDAVKQICEHFGLDFVNVQKELRELHHDAEELT